ncbi:MAG: signal recognition particle protein, partial [Actinobacteria bacterium]|nr:signal recognition particle protein [Actinomycetota bacterium]
RRVPHLIDGSRRKRIAAGSGTTVTQVNQLLEARKQMAQMMKMVGSGKMPQIPGQQMPGQHRKKSHTKKRKKARR